MKSRAITSREARSLLVAFTVLCALLPWVARGRPANVRFERLTTDDGLSSQRVHRIFQDREGFLWLGTADGLDRYDGYRFVRHPRSRESRSVFHGDVRVVHEDRQGVFWVGTYDSGLLELDRAAGTSVHHRHDPADPRSLSDDSVVSFHEDSAGTIWVGTDSGGLNRLDRTAGAFAQYRHDPADPSSLGDDEVNAVTEDAAGTLWVGTGGGLDRFDPERGAFVRYLDGDRVEALLAEESGGLWVGTYDGLVKLDPATGGVTRWRHDPANAESLSQDRISTLALSSSGLLWIGTWGGGLNGFDGAAPGTAAGVFSRHRHVHDWDDTLSDNGVRDIYEDSSGLLWVATVVGLNKYNPLTAAFDHYYPDPPHHDELSDHRVRAIHEDRAGDVWVGTTNGLERLGRTREVVTHYQHRTDDPASLSDDHVSAIHEDRAGALWVGTPYAGLNRLDRGTGAFVHYRHDPDDPRSLSSDDVLVIFEDSSPALWIGTWGGGLNRLERRTGTFVRYRHDPAAAASLPDDRVLALHEGPAGGLWIGVDRAGLGRFDPLAGTFTFYPLAPPDGGSAAGDRVYAIHGDGSPGLWAGTHHRGICRFDTGDRSFTCRSVNDGLASDTVFGILPDAAGGLWLSTPNGLSRFDPQAGSFRNYDVTDGLQGNEFGIHSAFRTAAGELLFGGNNGFTAFFPEDVEDNDHVPPVVLSSFKVFNEEIDLGAAGTPGRAIEISHRDDFISLEFAALDFAAPDKNRYAYRLDGRGDDWIELGKKRDVTFTDLAPGDYVLRVKGSNNHGVWNEDGLSLDLRVAAPWWHTWWFRAAGALASAALLLVAHRRRSRATRAIRERNRALELEVRERKRVEDALRASIAERRRAEAERETLISELEAKNTELERFTYTVSHDLKSPLLTIRGFLGHLKKDAAAGNQERVDKDVAFISKAAATMHQLLDELLELSRIGRMVNPDEEIDLVELAREAVDLVATQIAERGVEVEIADDLGVVVGDRVRLLEVFQNLVDNAVKFIGDQASPRVEVGARRRGGETHLYVRDNGLGIDPRFHDKVFGLFDRLNRHVEGTGIGLTLAQRIVEVHGGRIWVESEGVGHGSTFVFTLPPR